MTFDLDPATAALQQRARQSAGAVSSALAAAIDADGRIPGDLLQQAGAALPAPADPQAWVVCIEELAVASGALAVQAAGAALDDAGSPAASTAWAGLRGADVDGLRNRLADAGLWHLSVSAVLVGLGRAALETALPVLRAARAAGGKPEQEQWPVADAATAVAAARLLVWRAATSLSAEPASAPAALGMARLLAVDAAHAAVAAARRALDAEASRPGEALDRITRDVATAALVFGKAEAQEAAVAAGVLPA